MTNGNLALTDSQKAAIVDFVRDGGGFVGVHCAALTLCDYPEFGEMLGGYFRRSVSQDRIFVLKVEDPDHPATEMLGPSWPVQDEFYVYGKEAWEERRPEENVDELFGHPIPVAFSRDRVQVLVSIDTERSDFSGLDGLSPDDDYPRVAADLRPGAVLLHRSRPYRADLEPRSRLPRPRAGRHPVGPGAGRLTSPLSVLPIPPSGPRPRTGAPRPRSANGGRWRRPWSRSGSRRGPRRPRAGRPRSRRSGPRCR